MEKIAAIIRESRLAVHDISRTQMDRGTRLPHFNMPLELGIFLGAKSFGSRDDQEKVAIILDTERAATRSWNDTTDFVAIYRPCAARCTWTSAG
jgi:hypothetical protein